MVKEEQLITEAAAKLIEDARQFLEQKVSSITITSEVEYEGAGALIKELKTKKKSLDDTRKEEKEPHLEAGRAVDGEFQPVIKMLEEKISLIESAGRKYRQLIEEQARARQKALEDAAEADRKRLEDQAGTNKEKADSLRKAAAELRDKAEKLGRGTDEYCRLMNEAAKYENRALKYDDKADAKQQQAAQTVAPLVTAEIPKTGRGAFNTREYWKAKITNKQLFIEHVAKTGQIHLVDENVSNLNKMAEMVKGPSPIPGVEFHKL